MDKQDLVDQLILRLRAAASAALSASEASAQEAKEGATPAEKREDARAAHQASTLGKAQTRRAQQAIAEIDSLGTFRPGPLTAKAPIAVGAVVEIEDVESGEGRTFFLAPVGAGVTLTGPGGDGYLSVVTPSSPVGRAVLGRRAGEVIDVTVEREVREWTITYVG
ncbi:MAG: GreA/GreB family elongation factor [Myxococcales bacterium]|nr:GreA/GreB family elongation factor [Myxococcales bacterium]